MHVVLYYDHSFQIYRELVSGISDWDEVTSLRHIQIGLIILFHDDIFMGESVAVYCAPVMFQ